MQGNASFAYLTKPGAFPINLIFTQRFGNSHAADKKG
jgi:hypothetical protein